MRIAIVGYGRMGHEVERALTARGHEVGAVVDPLAAKNGAAIPAGASAHEHLGPETLAGCDVAIEFSLADAVANNAGIYATAGCPVVVGTTGWLDRLGEVKTVVENAGTGMVYGSNFSIGAHIFFEAASYAAGLVSEIAEYDLLIHEIHHRKKVDSPSGTALSLAEKVIASVPRKQKVETGRLDEAPGEDVLHVSSSRVGSVPGTHSLVLDSPADTIEVRHQARNRGGFALGAVLAAEWVVSHPGFHPVEEFVGSLLHGNEGA